MSHEFPTSTVKVDALTSDRLLNFSAANANPEEFNGYRMAIPDSGRSAAVPNAFKSPDGTDIVLTDKEAMSFAARGSNLGVETGVAGSQSEAQLMSSGGPLNNWHGWHRTGTGSWIKDTPLPPNWATMSPQERAAWNQQLMEAAINDWTLVGPGGAAKVGWHTDPETGERFWFGYAGQEPGPDPDPYGRNDRG